MTTTKMMLSWELMTIPERLVGIVDSITSGVRIAQRPDGVTVAQSFALLYDGDELHSDVFTLVAQADPAPTDAIKDGIRAISGAAQQERAISAAIARATMKSGDRSPMDMISISQQLLSDARNRERQWMKERDKAIEEKRLDDEAVEIYKKWERGRALVEGKK